MVGHVDIDARRWRSLPDASAKGGRRRWLTPLIAMAALALDVDLLSRTIGRYSLDELRAAVTGFPLHRLALAQPARRWAPTRAARDTRLSIHGMRATG